MHFFFFNDLNYNVHAWKQNIWLIANILKNIGEERTNLDRENEKLKWKSIILGILWALVSDV